MIGGELNPVFQGVYSSRIELKQWMREDERVLGNAEKIGAIAEVLGAAGPGRKALARRPLASLGAGPL